MTKKLLAIDEAQRNLADAKHGVVVCARTLDELHVFKDDPRIRVSVSRAEWNRLQAAITQLAIAEAAAIRLLAEQQEDLARAATDGYLITVSRDRRGVVRINATDEHGETEMVTLREFERQERVVKFVRSMLDQLAPDNEPSGGPE
jgi:hypothetical protein